MRRPRLLALVVMLALVALLAAGLVPAWDYVWQKGTPPGPRRRSVVGSVRGRCRERRWLESHAPVTEIHGPAASGPCGLRGTRAGPHAGAMTSLDLALIGNGATSALVTADGDVVWACMPGFDGDPVFCSLLQNPQDGTSVAGHFAIALSDVVRSEQEYVANTPVLVTRLFDRGGGSIEITDVIPRFHQHGRVFSPMMLVRQVRRTSGRPRIRILLRPAEDYGTRSATSTHGSNHIRYQCGDLALRLTTDASVTAILDANVFYLEEGITLLLGPDETVSARVAELGRHFIEETVAYWREWV